MYVYFTFWLVQITPQSLVITGVLQPALRICTQACIVASAVLQQRLQLLALILTIISEFLVYQMMINYT